MLRVCINGVTESDQIRGPVRYIYELTEHLSGKNLEILLVAGSWQKKVYKSLENKVEIVYYDMPKDKVSRGLFFIFMIPFILKARKIDLYHIPDTNPISLNILNVPVISTIHDSAEYIVPNRFGRIQALCRRTISFLQARFSDHIITVSKSAKNDIVNHLSVEEEKVTVIHQGATFRKGEDVKNDHTENKIDDEKYILYVGVIEREKNVALLIEAYSVLPKTIREIYKLYIVGRKGNATEDVQSTITNLHLENYVRLIGYVNDHELELLYQKAIVFTYLSGYEGFGLPILEAMSFGLPVLTARNSSLIEVGGDAVVFTNLDAQEIAEKLYGLVTDGDLRQYMAKKGSERVLDFSWEKTARETYKLYANLITERML